MIRRVSPDGSKIETIAGNATDRTAPLGDGKPALEAHIGAGQRHDGRARRHDLLGRALQPDATTGRAACASSRRTASSPPSRAAATRSPTNGTPASEVAIGGDPKGVAVGPDGSIYLALRLEKKVIRIDPAGATTRFAGKGVTGRARQDRRPAARRTTSYIDSPFSIAAANDGTVYIRSLGYDVSPSASRDPEGRRGRHRCSRPPGACSAPAAPAGPTARARPASACQNHSTTIGVDGDGGVTFADGRYLIRKVAPPLPGFDAEGLALPSADGLEVYEFDRNGRHLRTRDGLTGAVTKTFEYDAAKRLVGVVDAYGNRTRIERDGAGMATAIVAPGGQRTGLTIDAGGFLESVTDPGRQGARVHLPRRAACSRASRSPRAARPASTTTPTGRLTRHRGADGEERTLTRTEGEFGPTVAIKTAGGKTTKYSMEVLANGDRRRTVQEPSGAKTVSVVGVDGLTELTEPDGTKTDGRVRARSPLGAAVQIVADKTVTTPSGKSTRTKRSDTRRADATRATRSRSRSCGRRSTSTASQLVVDVRQARPGHAAQRRGPRDGADARRQGPRDQADARHRRGARSTTPTTSSGARRR